MQVADCLVWDVYTSTHSMVVTVNNMQRESRVFRCHFYCDRVYVVRLN